LAKLLRKLGFEPVSADSSFWVRASASPVIVYLTSVVDDMLITSCDDDVSLEVVKAVLEVFEGTDGGEAHHYNGMKLTWLRDEHAVLLTQHAHVDALVVKYQTIVDDWAPRALPMKDGLRLHKGGTSEVLESEPLDVSKYPYRALVGSLNYLACATRPDIAMRLHKHIGMLRSIA
jgi:hypothetical protein